MENHNSPKCPCCSAYVAPLDLLMDEVAGTISYDGKSARFPAAQFRLVRALAEVYPNVLTKDECLSVVQNDAVNPPHPKIVDVQICHARKRADKIGLIITTVWGVGYQLELNEQATADDIKSSRFSETRKVRSAIDSSDVMVVRMLLSKGHPLTDIARRLRLTYRAATRAAEQVAEQRSRRPFTAPGDKPTITAN